jgi:protein involved in polysaccharide export with SLBB domain
VHSNVRAFIRLTLGCLFCLVLAACPRTLPTQEHLPPPVHSTTVGPGDIFVVRVVGEDLPDKYQVGSNGTVELPYVGRVKVAGYEPEEISRRLQELLKAKEILVDPTVVVVVEAYRSKRVTLLGQVASPGSFPLGQSMTLTEAVSLAGGLSAVADRDSIYVTRKTADGTVTAVVSIEDINEGAPDIPLQAGDRIFVNERVF